MLKIYPKERTAKNTKNSKNTKKIRRRTVFLDLRLVTLVFLVVTSSPVVVVRPARVPELVAPLVSPLAGPVSVESDRGRR